MICWSNKLFSYSRWKSPFTDFMRFWFLAFYSASLEVMEVLVDRYVQNSQSSIDMVWLQVFLIQDSTPVDFLQDHIPIYVAIVIGLFVLQSVVLFFMGQPLLPPTRLVFWYGDVNGPGNSQHISDWYSFTHVLHGFIFYFVAYGLRVLLPVFTVNYGYLLALCTAVTWEIVENTPCVINRYRQTAVASGYNGDSVINSMCDSIACTLGYWISYFTPWWIILPLAIAEEIILAIIIRDNLTINVIQILFSLKSISEWQARNNKSQVVSTSDADKDIDIR